jgi:histidinol phosphatase-like PHP family hydrolase
MALYKIDMHVHTKYSKDNVSEPEAMIRAAIKNRLHGIVFTEHHSYLASSPIEALRKKYEKYILILRGAEYSSAWGHLLIYGVKTDDFNVEKYATAIDIITMVGKLGGVVIPAHPYRDFTSEIPFMKHIMGNNIYKLKKYIPSLEGYNGRSFSIENSLSVRAAKKIGVPFIGGSDAHYPREVGVAYTIFREKITRKNFIEVLKKGNYFGVIDESRRLTIW